MGNPPAIGRARASGGSACAAFTARRDTTVAIGRAYGTFATAAAWTSRIPLPREEKWTESTSPDSLWELQFRSPLRDMEKWCERLSVPVGSRARWPIPPADMDLRGMLTFAWPFARMGGRCRRACIRQSISSKGESAMSLTVLLKCVDCRTRNRCTGRSSYHRGRHTGCIVRAAVAGDGTWARAGCLALPVPRLTATARQPGRARSPNHAGSRPSFDLPAGDALAKGASLSISVSRPGSDAGKITPRAPSPSPSASSLSPELAPMPNRSRRDMARTRPSVLREWKEKEAEATRRLGGQDRVAGACDSSEPLSPARQRLRGCGVARSRAVATPPVAGRKGRHPPDGASHGVSAGSLRLPDRRGVAAFSGGDAHANGSGHAQGRNTASPGSMLAGFRCSCSALRRGWRLWTSRPSSGDTSIGPRARGSCGAPVPARPYAAAYVLLHRRGDAGKAAAMGFGLRPPETCAGDLKNIYLDGRPDYRPDEGVTVQAVPALGEGWYVARVPLNPAAVHGTRTARTATCCRSDRLQLSRPTSAAPGRMPAACPARWRALVALGRGGHTRRGRRST